MSFRYYFKSISILVGCVWLSATVQAKDRWQQVPGAPVWVEVPAGWQATAHRQKHALELRDAQRGRCTLYAVRSGKVTEAAFLEDIQSDLDRQYGAVTWKRGQKRVQGGVIQHEEKVYQASLRHQRAFRVKKENWRVALLTIAPDDEWETVSATALALFKNKAVGWSRPRPRWLRVPGTNYQVRHPQGGWRVSATDSAAVHLANALLYGTMQAARMPARNNNLETVVALYVEGLSQGEGQWTWTSPKRWRVRSVKRVGVHRRGEATLRRKRSDVVYRMDLYAFPHKNEVIIVLGTSSGDGLTPVSMATKTMANSIRKKRP
jgi:hypothetical protein